MLEEFKDLRDQTLQVLKEVAAYGEAKAEDPEGASALMQHHDKILENRFQILAASSFSVGKTTFLNALMSRDLLKTDNRECTSALTRIRYAETPRLIVKREGAPDKATDNEHEIERWLDLYSTKLPPNPPEDETVKELVLEYPLKLASAGTEIVDAPGVDSLEELSEEITYNAVALSDAIILLVDATRPGARSDLNFVRRVRSHRIKNVFFVLNKIDNLKTPQQIVDAVEAVANMVKNDIPDARVFPVSAYHALASRMLASGEWGVAKCQDDRDLLFRCPETNQWRGVERPDDHGALMEQSKFEAFEHELSEFLLGTTKGYHSLTLAHDACMSKIQRYISGIEDLIRLLESDEDQAVLERRFDAANIELIDATNKLGDVEEIIDDAKAELSTKFKVGMAVGGQAFNELIQDCFRYVDERSLKQLAKNKGKDLGAYCEQQFKAYAEKQFSEAETIVINAITNARKEAERILKDVNDRVNVALNFDTAVTQRASEDDVNAGWWTVGGGVGGAAAGAIVGAFVGGPPGAAIGAAIGGVLGLLARWFGDNEQDVKKKIKQQLERTLTALDEKMRPKAENQLRDSLDEQWKAIRQASKRILNERRKNIKSAKVALNQHKANKAKQAQRYRDEIKILEAHKAKITALKAKCETAE